MSVHWDWALGHSVLRPASLRASFRPVYQPAHELGGHIRCAGVDRSWRRSMGGGVQTGRLIDARRVTVRCVAGEEYAPHGPSVAVIIVESQVLPRA